MAASETDAYDAYWQAIQRRVCAVCLDAADDGTCGLGLTRVCALQDRLPLIVRTIMQVTSDRMDEYVSAIEKAVCAGCREQDARGHCGLRANAECGLYTYLPLVVDAIEEVRGISLEIR
jgi:hypothetical protein